MLNLALERPFCAKSPTQTWLNTSNKSNQKSHASSCCIISIYFSCRSYQLWGSASDLFPHACHECEAAKPGETAEGKRAGHGTKHVLHVGALTPQFRQMAGINNSMDIGYQRLTPLDVKSHVLLCLCPAFGLPNFSADLHSQNTLDMLRSFRNFRTSTKCTSNWTSRSWRCRLARFCFCSWTTALANHQVARATDLRNWRNWATRVLESSDV